MSHPLERLLRMADKAILKMALQQDGVLTFDQAEAVAGQSRRAVRRRIESGEYIRVHRDVVSLAGWSVGARTPLWIATLAIPDAVVARWSASELLGLPIRRPDDDCARVVIPKSRTNRIPGVRVHETRLLRPSDSTMIEGLCVTTPARTLVDLASETREQRYFDNVDRCVAHRHLEISDLAATYQSLTRQGRPGRLLIEGYLSSRLESAPVSSSELEYLFDEIIRSSGLSKPVPQFRPPWYDGGRGIVDRAWPAARLIVELDGRSFHDTMRAKRDDLRRDRMAVRNGWSCVRYGYLEVTRGPREMVDEIRDILRVNLAA